MSTLGRDSVRCGSPPKLSQHRLSSTTCEPFLRFFFGCEVAVVLVSTVPYEMPLSFVSSVPCGRSLDLTTRATTAPATSRRRTIRMRRSRRRTESSPVCQRRPTPLGLNRGPATLRRDRGRSDVHPRRGECAAAERRARDDQGELRVAELCARFSGGVDGPAGGCGRLAEGVPLRSAGS